ncbi:MAG: hypothetical protein Ct9H300mP28_13790 [Pseudomonadota bacterium]|nr:MAG: hypothetical protein Ct9H300mP28_13790 [Pseudomonadota bacterium]
MEALKQFLFLPIKAGLAAPWKFWEKGIKSTTLPLYAQRVHNQLLSTFGRPTRGASAGLILAYFFQQTELAKIVTEAKNIGLEAVVECSLKMNYQDTCC